MFHDKKNKKMANLPFEKEEYEIRLFKIRQNLRAHNISALICSVPENIFYFTNYHTPGDCFCVLVLELDKEPFIITRALEGTNVLFRANCSYKTYSEQEIPVHMLWTYIERQTINGRVAFEANSKSFTIEHHLFLSENLTQRLEWVDFSKIIAQQRSKKSDKEIEYITTGSSIVERAVEDLETLISAENVCEMCECELSGFITHKVMTKGSLYTSYPVFVASGKNGCIGHHAAENSIIQKNGPLFVEFAACVHRYHYAKMITFFVGKETPDWFVRIKNAILKAGELCIAYCRPKIQAKHLDVIMRTYMNSHLENDETMLERSGYSIGIGLTSDWSEKEAIRIDPYNLETLEENMVLHIIPWVQKDNVGALGFSKMIRVTENGGIFL